MLSRARGYMPVQGGHSVNLSTVFTVPQRKELLGKAGGISTRWRSIRIHDKRS